jgi:hypothetical protein
VRCGSSGELSAISGELSATSVQPPIRRVGSGLFEGCAARPRDGEDASLPIKEAIMRFDLDGLAGKKLVLVSRQDLRSLARSR